MTAAEFFSESPEVSAGTLLISRIGIHCHWSMIEVLTVQSQCPSFTLSSLYALLLQNTKGPPHSRFHSPRLGLPCNSNGPQKQQLKTWIRLHSKKTNNVGDAVRKAPESLTKALFSQRAKHRVHRPIELFQKTYAKRISIAIAAEPRELPGGEDVDDGVSTQDAALADAVDNILTSDGSQATADDEARDNSSVSVGTAGTIPDDDEDDVDVGREEKSRQRMAVRNRVVARLFGELSVEEREELDRMVAAEKEALEAEQTGKDPESDSEEPTGRTPQEYMVSINESVEVLTKVHKVLQERTGWYGMTVFGGCNPSQGGKVSMKIVNWGLDSNGHTFQTFLGEEHCKLHIGMPFQAFLKGCFSPEVRKARALPVKPKEKQALPEMEKDFMSSDEAGGTEKIKKKKKKKKAKASSAAITTSAAVSCVPVVAPVVPNPTSSQPPSSSITPEPAPMEGRPLEDENLLDDLGIPHDDDQLFFDDYSSGANDDTLHSTTPPTTYPDSQTPAGMLLRAEACIASRERGPNAGLPILASPRLESFIAARECGSHAMDELMRTGSHAGVKVFDLNPIPIDPQLLPSTPRHPHRPLNTNAFLTPQHSHLQLASTIALSRGGVASSPIRPSSIFPSFHAPPTSFAALLKDQSLSARARAPAAHTAQITLCPSITPPAPVEEPSVIVPPAPVNPVARITPAAESAPTTSVEQPNPVPVPPPIELPASITSDSLPPIPSLTAVATSQIHSRPMAKPLKKAVSVSREEVIAKTAATKAKTAADKATRAAALKERAEKARAAKAKKAAEDAVNSREGVMSLVDASNNVQGVAAAEPAGSAATPPELIFSISGGYNHTAAGRRRAATRAENARVHNPDGETPLIILPPPDAPNDGLGPRSRRTVTTEMKQIARPSTRQLTHAEGKATPATTKTPLVPTRGHGKRPLCVNVRGVVVVHDEAALLSTYLLPLQQKAVHWPARNPVYWEKARAAEERDLAGSDGVVSSDEPRALAQSRRVTHAKQRVSADVRGEGVVSTDGQERIRYRPSARPRARTINRGTVVGRVREGGHGMGKTQW
ncbi:hypothetical protein FB45DRAFT_1008019 [Roridomyces roridus]|uniref:Uncharacterized protein n=1 Tax=Roridomyces roridus TaxID=1738132 RepID=A0AAD7BCG2_9AGAR|nr:hypothetical protein FB45DRAFT_1008019 [Roridomyces roridus]